MGLYKKCTECNKLEELDGKQVCVRIHPISGLVIHVNPTKEREAGLKATFKCGQTGRFFKEKADD